ncbi:MAG: phosphoribosyl-AMP cyclohydrolase [Spirochaetaceae bacterium]|nr:MAG: phosphoribosyl-AMP cyclohydrolase [Spirochaetaceae bacterium]
MKPYDANRPPRVHQREPRQELRLDFEKQDGMITVVTQDAATREVLMVAFMNRQAWDKSLETGIAHYYSRSRGRLWKKGETSGHVQQIREIRVDCDQDAVLLLVDQTGVACHTGNRSCFYRRYGDGELRPVAGVPDGGREGGSENSL